MKKIKWGNLYAVLTVLATVLFVTLKINGAIDWSWWWVTVPVWGSLALAVLTVVVAIIIALFFIKEIPENVN